MASDAPNIDSTLGALSIGFALVCAMYGIFAIQIFSYFRNYPRDKLYLKVLVVITLILETANQCFIGYLLYYYTISNYLNPVALKQATLTWPLILQLAAGTVVGFIVKACFAIRIWRFSDRNIWITGFVLLLDLAQLGLALAFTVKAFMLPNIFAVHELLTLGTISLGVGVATDIIIAGALCLFLNRLRTGLKPSDTLVNNLCRYAINTGAFTSAVSTATLLLYNLRPLNNLYFAATYIILSELYAISFLATLNTRRRRTDDHKGAVTSDTNMFYLGTRCPSVGPKDLDDQWDEVDTPFSTQQDMISGRPLP